MRFTRLAHHYCAKLIWKNSLLMFVIDLPLATNGKSLTEVTARNQISEIQDESKLSAKRNK